MELFKFNDLDKKSVVISSLIDISQFANISGLFRIMPYLNGIKTKDKHLNFSLGVEGHEFKSPELNISTENPENI